MNRAGSAVVLLLVGSMAGWAISVEPGISYLQSTGTPANFAVIGLPFYLNKPITVTALGVFDYGYDNPALKGLSGSITVSIYSWNPATPFSLGTQHVSTTLNNSSSFVAGTGSVWNYVGAPTGVNLNTIGWYVLLAEGFTYNGSNPDMAVLTNNTYYATDTFNGAVSYGYQPAPSLLPGYYGALVGPNIGALSWFISQNNPIPVAAGTLGVPEPSTYALMGTVGLALYLLRRRKASANKG